MEEIPFGEDRILVAPPTVEAWQALYSVLEQHGYDVRVDDTDSYNCRSIKGRSVKSLHSFGIALDINWHTNPWIDHKGKRAVRFSGRGSQEGRAGDVKLGRADTDMTPRMIADVARIATNEGKRVFEWGGNWNSVKDAMHFEIRLAPADFKAGIDWRTVSGARGPEDSGGWVADVEDYSPYKDYFHDLIDDELEGGDNDFELTLGDRGPMVKALQNSLVQLGYQVGETDGIFGRMTRDALFAFQGDNDIQVNGIYDAITMAAMEKGQRRTIDAKRMRETEEELVLGGSETMKRSRWNRRIGIGTIILGALGLTDKQTDFVTNSLGAIREAAGGGEAAGNAGVFDSVLTLLQGLLSSGGAGIWPIIGILGFTIWRNGDKAAKSRLDDHQTGANRKH